MEAKVTSDGENPEDVDMNGGGDTNAHQQPDLGSTSSEAEAVINQNPSDHSQSVDETNQATSPSDGDTFLNDMMKPASKDAGFFVDQTAMSGVYDHNDPFQLSASVRLYPAPNTELDSDIATQIHMAESLETVNQKPLFLTVDNESSSQDKTTDTRQPSAPTELTTSKAAFEAAISANYDLASTVLGTLQTKAREPTDDHLQGTEAHRAKATNVRTVLERFITLWS